MGCRGTGSSRKGDKGYDSQDRLWQREAQEKAFEIS